METVVSFISGYITSTFNYCITSYTIIKMEEPIKLKDYILNIYNNIINLKKILKQNNNY